MKTYINFTQFKKILLNSSIFLIEHKHNYMPIDSITMETDKYKHINKINLFTSIRNNKSISITKKSKIHINQQRNTITIDDKHVFIPFQEINLQTSSFNKKINKKYLNSLRSWHLPCFTNE